MFRSCAFLVILCSMSMGCAGTYHYYTDPTQSLQNDRYQYVKYHPSAPHNNEILSGKILKGMSREEIQASWGRPAAIAPGDVAGIDEVWAYHDPDTAHGNTVYMLRFADGSLHKVEKLVGMAMAGNKSQDGEHLGEQETAEQTDKPWE